MVAQHRRSAPLRRAAAVAPGPGRPSSPRSTPPARSACASRASGWMARQRTRPLRRGEIHRSGRQKLLRPGLFPPRSEPYRRSRSPARGAMPASASRRSISSDLGRRLADQGRRERPCLCGRRAGTADRASRHQPRAAQHDASRLAQVATRDDAAAQSDALNAAKNLQGCRAHGVRAGQPARLAGVRRAADQRAMRRSMRALPSGLIVFTGLIFAVLSGMFPRAAWSV